MPSIEIRKLDKYLVQRCQHIASHNFSYTVWEPAESPPNDAWPAHSTITKFEGYAHWCGKLGTRQLTPEINALPVGEERFVACDRFRRAQDRLAYRIIGKAFPHVLSLITRGYARQESHGCIATTEIM